MSYSATRNRNILTAFIATGFAVALSFLPARTIPVAAAADAAAIFRSKCANCHGADGGGKTAVGKSMRLRDLRSAQIQGMSDEALFNVIANGKGKMPGYSKSLGADTCRALVAYIRSLK